jgi:uncharacterized protein YndB with AHSA1/START domain
MEDERPQYRTTIDIDATPETVWSVLVDLERWPSWTASTNSVTRLDSGAFELGSAVRVKQPRLPTAVWRVTAFERGTSFTWVTRSPGLETSGRHTVVPRASGGVTVVLEAWQSGALARLVGLLISGLGRRYVEMEAAGLKQRCERG